MRRLLSILLALAGSGLLAAACSGVSIVGTDPNTGMIVSVFKSPIEPVSREGVDNSAPVEGATVSLRLLDTGSRLTLTTGADGVASTLLNPGSYEVRVLECPLTLGLPDPEEALVVPGSFALVRLDCDTGIR